MCSYLQRKACSSCPGWQPWGRGLAQCAWSHWQTHLRRENRTFTQNCSLSQDIIRLSWQICPKLTSQDGLVNTQGGGLDGNNPDVSGDFVTNCGESQRRHHWNEFLIFLLNSHYYIEHKINAAVVSQGTELTPRTSQMTWNMQRLLDLLHFLDYSFSIFHEFLHVFFVLFIFLTFFFFSIGKHFLMSALEWC